MITPELTMAMLVLSKADGSEQKAFHCDGTWFLCAAICIGVKSLRTNFDSVNVHFNVSSDSYVD